MDSRERVIRTLGFSSPDRLPINLWTLPATHTKYGKAMDELLNKYEQDLELLVAPLDLAFDPKTYQKGVHHDDWGCEWIVLQEGIVGEVKNPLLTSPERIHAYKSPQDDFKKKWQEYHPELDHLLKEARRKGKFILGGWSNPFERMQFLRGTENLYCDMALKNDEFFNVRDMVFDYYKEYVASWLEKDIDGTVVGDDWGAQRSLLISPNMWRELFKPLYKEIFDMVKTKGKYIFVHCDGYIMDIYEDFIEMGVDAINSQLWCMGVENVAAKFAGRVTFWGEISRQDILPKGSAEDVKKAAETMKQYLYINGGGLIGQSEAGPDVPLENIESVLSSWN